MCLLLLYLVWCGVASPTEPDCLNLQASSAPSVQGRSVAVPSLGTLSPLPFCLLLCCPTLCLRLSKTRSTWLPLLTFLVWPHPFFNNPLSLVPVSLLYLQSWWHKLWLANLWISATFSRRICQKLNPSLNCCLMGMPFSPPLPRDNTGTSRALCLGPKRSQFFPWSLFSHFQHRWRDLMSYKLLILRTYWQFAGRVWLAYDCAICQHAAATKLQDWSSMDVQLFNFHSAGASPWIHSVSPLSGA